jgi:hypothetical protein
MGARRNLLKLQAPTSKRPEKLQLEALKKLGVHGFQTLQSFVKSALKERPPQDSGVVAEL